MDGLFGQEFSRPFCRPLGDGTGPLYFCGEQDALSLAVRGRDGLQLQKVQQHLDLPEQSEGAKAAQKGAHGCRWEVLLAKAQGLVTQAAGQLRVLRAPSGDGSPSQQEIQVPLKDHPEEPSKVQGQVPSL